MTPEQAYDILENDHNRWHPRWFPTGTPAARESLEHTICSDAKYSYCYARNVIKGRWELGEAAISKKAWYSYCYARDVIGGRFELGEAAISEDAIHSYEYAKDVIKGRFELGEAAISKKARESYCYAGYVIHGRWELGEAAISKDAKYAEFYAKYFMKANWTPELAVMCPCWLYTYAKDVIKGRLPSTMHNKMIVFGMIDSSDKYVKKYLGAKKYCTLKGIRATKQKKLKCKIQDRC